MPCYYPIQAYYGDRKPNGKYSIVFDERQKSSSQDLKLPCGQCIGCRLERSRKWAMRCYAESQMYSKNCFITLTFDDEHLPSNRSVDVKDFQSFMERLRKWHLWNNCPYSESEKDMRSAWLKDNGIRYFHCGEYGEACFNCDLSKFYCRCVNYVKALGRPHYHACLFNFDFEDKVLHTVKNGLRYYKSDILKKLWPFGNNIIADVTFESAAYVARYIVDKLNGKKEKEVSEETGLRHYERLDFSTGEVLDRNKEYTTMSRRPGIGSTWFDKYHSDVFPKDYLYIPNRGRMKPGRYFDSLFERKFPEMFTEVQMSRESDFYENMERMTANSTPQRLKVRETCQLAKLNLLKRGLD